MAVSKKNTASPSPSVKKKVKGAIIQNKQTKSFYDSMRSSSLELPKLSAKERAKVVKSYVSSTKALKNKTVPSLYRSQVQAARASAAGILSVDTARKTKKVSGPKSKRGN